MEKFKVPLAMELGRELGDWLAMAWVQEKDPQFRCKKNPNLFAVFNLQLMVMSLVERLADQCTS